MYHLIKPILISWEAKHIADYEKMNEIKSENIINAVNYLKTAGSCTVSEIAEKCGISFPTAKNILNYAVDKKIAFESHTAPSTGGRKAAVYKVNPEYCCRAYVIIENNTLIFRICDFTGRVCEETKREINLNNFIDDTTAEYNRLKKSRNVSALVMSLPCVVSNGEIKDWYYNPAYVGKNVSNLLSERLGIACFVENDMKLAVLGRAEKYANAKRSTVACVQFGHNGIGIGEYVNGKILRGMSDFAGEVGYIDDVTKSISSVRYCSKIIKNLIIFLNPEKIVFYTSQHQSNIEEIMKSATRALPPYSVPEFEVSTDYIDDINAGLKFISDEFAENKYF